MLEPLTRENTLQHLEELDRCDEMIQTGQFSLSRSSSALKMDEGHVVESPEKASLLDPKVDFVLSEILFKY